MSPEIAVPQMNSISQWSRLRNSTFLVVPIILAAVFVQLLDVSIVNVAVPSIQRQLHASFASVELVIAGYQLGFALTLLTASRLGDQLGHKTLFMVGMAGFTVSSAVCGAAGNQETLVIARMVQGVFSGLMFPQALSIIQLSFPEKERGRIYGFYGATIGLATILGPLVGGLLIRWNPGGLGWRTIFYVNAPVGVVAFFGAWSFLKQTKLADSEGLDLFGALLATMALGFLIFPLIEGRQEGWPLAMKIMFTLSLPMLMGFGLYERRRSKGSAGSLLKWGLLQERSFVIGLALSTVFFLGLAPFFFAFAIYLQLGLGFSPLYAGLTTIPFALGTAIASTVSNRLTLRLGKWVLALGCGLLVASMAGLSLAVTRYGPGLNGYQIAPILVIGGLGAGCFIAPMTTLVLRRVPNTDAGAASGMLSTIQQVGGALGVAMLGVVFFGLLGVNSTAATASVMPALDHRLVRLGVPSLLRIEGEQAFAICVHDRSTAKDPTVLPNSCLRLGAAIETAPIPASVRSQLLHDLINFGESAAEIDFAKSVQGTLYYEIFVFVLAFFAVLALPVDPDPDPARDGGRNRGIDG